MAEDDAIYMDLSRPLPGPARITVPSTRQPANDEIASRLSLLVKGLELEATDPLSGSLDQASGASVLYELRLPTDEERIANESGDAVCILQSVRRAPQVVRDEFDAMLRDETYLSGDVIESRTEPFVVGEQWTLRRFTAEPLRSSSPAFLAFRNEQLLELHKVARKLIGWIWWRGGAYGNFSLQREVLYWSRDGKEWLLIPSAIAVHHEEIPGVSLPEGMAEEVVAVGLGALEEPLGHELFREAWGHLHVQPRSALLLGIAAAEVGMKQWIARAAPDAAWLVEIGPSPPLEYMMQEYLPVLVRAKLNLEFELRPSKQTIVRTIVDGVNARNTIAHSPPTSRRYRDAASYLEYANIGKLEELLLAVSDFLWLLDSLLLRLQGDDPGWALARVRADTRSTCSLRPATA